MVQEIEEQEEMQFQKVEENKRGQKEVEQQ